MLQPTRDVTGWTVRGHGSEATNPERLNPRGAPSERRQAPRSPARFRVQMTTETVIMLGGPPLAGRPAEHVERGGGVLVPAPRRRAPADRGPVPPRGERLPEPAGERGDVVDR